MWARLTTCQVLHPLVLWCSLLLFAHGAQSDVHAERVEQHRKAHRRSQLTFSYVLLPHTAQGSSAAQQCEADCIRLLQAAGFSVRSLHDARVQPRALA